MRAAAAALAAVALAGGLAACSDDPNSISAQAKQGDNKGFVAGDGQIESLAVGQRKKPARLAGKTLDGKPWNLDSARGQVVVLNVWGSWCPPCQKELPHLQDAWATYQKGGKPVQFVGLLQRDTVDSASATLAKFKVTYPSLQDDGGKTLLGLQGRVVTTPTTLVIDKQGRIAARVSGETTATTVRTLVDQTLREQA
ncbi:TlpA disulfide reductase family protein [Luteipulveratus sp. YIM 133132]|uniref:TlpA disulfide reductase family protein n=1 Tax=Luteipulveratus flavus TaxID=3031728 RepID=A0ABT6CBJ4_9MICO|nr:MULTISPECIES: TlpA disulfide reductase family protein [unclassified Luteipulveratus]MDE9365019.1 TlpA disulfide reductase family protein [Luteipulveratus sp. YIM 133132]MDF8264641.1 TlpA disulfide reductase family protein [Luteipulveratus sp. YIM 133296]